MREKCPYLEFFWSVFSRIRTEYGEDANIHRRFDFSGYSIPQFLAKILKHFQTKLKVLFGIVFSVN